MQFQKQQNDLGSFPRQTIQHHSNPSLCLNNWGWRNWIWPVLWRPIRPSRANTKKRCPFHHQGIGMQRQEVKISRVTGKFGLWSIKWSRAKANRVSSREHIGHSKHPLPTTQGTTLHMDITKWPIMKSGWLYSLQQKMEKLYIIS